MRRSSAAMHDSAALTVLESPGEAGAASVVVEDKGVSGGLAVSIGSDVSSSSGGGGAGGGGLFPPAVPESGATLTPSSASKPASRAGRSPNRGVGVGLPRPTVRPSIAESILAAFSPGMGNGPDDLPPMPTTSPLSLAAGAHTPGTTPMSVSAPGSGIKPRLDPTKSVKKVTGDFTNI